MIEMTKKLAIFIPEIRNLIILLLYIVLFYLISPIVLGIFFAYLVFPIFRYIQRVIRLPFVVVIVILSIALFTVIGAILYLLLHSIVTLLPSIQASIEHLHVSYPAHILLPLLLEKFSAILNDLLLYFVNVLKNSLHFIFEGLIFIVSFYFALAESTRNRLWFFAYVPRTYREKWSRYFAKAMQLISYFLLVEMQLFTLTFILLSTGFYFLQFENFLIKAFLIAFADSLPFLGIGIFLIPLAIYFFIVGQSTTAIFTIALYIFVQIIRQLAESMLWSHTLHLRMIHTFFISAAAVLLFGLYGIILSPLLLMLAIKAKQHPIFER